MTSVTHTPDGVRNPRDSRRRVRYGAQRVLWTQSSLKRVRHCGRHLAHGQDAVQARVTVAPDGSRTAGFAGLQTCGSVWSCPVCSARVLGHRQTEITQAVDAWELTGGVVAMFTFTMKHDYSQPLELLWSALGDAWSSITSGGAYAAEKVTYGVETTRVVKTGKRAGQTVPTHVLPWLRVVEVTHGAAGWHVHVHAILFLPPVTDKPQVDELYGKMWARWQSGLVSAGVDGSLQVNRAEIFVGKEVSKRVGNYVTKNTYSAGQIAGLEAARSDLKNGRFGNRAPFEILRDLVLQPEGSNPERDAVLWRIFEQASRGKRQMTWAGGARALLGLDVEEMTDEEIAAEELGSADDCVGDIPKDSWLAVLRVAGRRAQIVEMLEDTSIPYDELGVCLSVLCDRWGTEWIRSTT